VGANIDEIAASFDTRAARYASGSWHVLCAERLVALCRLPLGSRVLDAATGTGFAALAAARAVGDEGHVLGVDISSGMLRQARSAVADSGLTNVEMIQADASCLPQCGSETFDAITCAAGLLYMSAADALREWHRLLRPGGIVAFSTMHAGSPPGGRIFRECAATFGISLRDPCAPLGSVAASARALTSAGFAVVKIVDEFIAFSAQDLALAWESNFGSIAHADVRALDQDRQQALHDVYVNALESREREHPGALSEAPILYAIGRKAADV
jgi:ubiquinone/menaquinone biosynthesis C-methylase UbiE